MSLLLCVWKVPLCLLLFFFFCLSKNKQNCIAFTSIVFRNRNLRGYGVNENNAILMCFIFNRSRYKYIFFLAKSTTLSMSDDALPLSWELLSALTVTRLYAFLFAFSACSTSSQIWPILPGVSHWIQYTQCVLILQIAVCEIHPTRSWGSSHITQNETAPRILPLFFHFAVLSGRLGTCSCEALWWKPIRQIFEECSGGAVIPGCQRVFHSFI